MRRVVVPHITALLLLLAGCGSGCGSGRDGSAPVMDERTPLPQERAERVFPAGELTVIDTVRVDDPTFWPVELEVLESGDLLVADRGSHQAIRLSADGEILTRFGSGVGEGPGEHQGVDKIGQLPDGTVWTWDVRNRRVILFDDDGSVVGTGSPVGAVQTATALTPEEFVGVSPLNPDPFVAFDSGGRVTTRWGWFVDEPAPNALPFVGQPHRLADGSGFVYVPQFAGRLYSYDADGGLIWHRSVIDRYDLPISTMDGMEFGEDGPPAQQFPVNVSDGDIHILVIHSDYEGFYVDTYDTRTGDYLHSLRIPLDRGCGPLFLRTEVLYMSCEMNIVRFQIPER